MIGTKCIMFLQLSYVLFVSDNKPRYLITIFYKISGFAFQVQCYESNLTPETAESCSCVLCAMPRLLSGSVSDQIMDIMRRKGTRTWSVWWRDGFLCIFTVAFGCFRLGRGKLLPGRVRKLAIQG